ncbi:4Fe-4S binding protein [Dehalococcoides mccartyi]|nr:4Fe-4S binding protein [Dehalococcoides mccartyi]
MRQFGTLFWGRIFCGWVYPTGTQQSFIYPKKWA